MFFSQITLEGCNRTYRVCVFFSYFRVCKRWNRLMRNGSLWKIIDFRCPVTIRKPTTNVTITWRFPLSENHVNKFLNVYATNCLKQIHLYVVTNAILGTLRAKCGQLSEISLLGIPVHTDLSLLPSSVTKCFVKYRKMVNNPLSISNHLNIATLVNLQVLSLSGAYLHKETHPSIGTLSNLTKLVLENCHGLSSEGFYTICSGLSKTLRELQLIYTNQCPRFSVIQLYLESVLLLLRLLSNFTLNITLDSVYRYRPLQIDYFLENMVKISHMQHLNLTFSRFPHRVFTEYGIRAMVIECPQLRELIFNECDDFTDTCISYISRYLPDLTLLDMRKCPVSDTGIKNLAYHSNLKILKICNCHDVSSNLLCQVLPTIPCISELHISSRSLSDADLNTLLQAIDLKIFLIP